ncbi:TPA: GNAT family N-acetyltransferase [Legionella pneumophila]
MTVVILPMHIEDIDAVASIHSSAFPRQTNSTKWVACNFAAFPRIMMYVARDGQHKVVGYIQWLHKSGFRNKAVIELEQIAVLQANQNQGVATKLIQTSLADVQLYLADNDATLKSIIVSTRADNKAQELYKKILGAEVVSVVKNLYSADEVLMIANK